MKKLLAALTIMFCMFTFLPCAAQEMDEQMINASLRFIKEEASLTKREYQRFAKLYIEYNEKLAKLNRELKPDSPRYMSSWSAINEEYMKGMEKALADSTRRKIGVAQWELGQKIWNEWAQQNHENARQQFFMMGQWDRMNPQSMMRPHMFDLQRRHEFEMEHAGEQQQQWWENYWRNWGRLDSAMLRRMEENRRRFLEQDSLWRQRRQQFYPQQGPSFTPQFGPQFTPQFGPGQPMPMPQRNMPVPGPR